MDIDVAWWDSPVSAAIYSDLVAKEKKLKTFHSVNYNEAVVSRRNLIEFFCYCSSSLQDKQGNRMSLEIRSLYLAAYLLDFYFSLDQRSLDLRYCYLVAAACLMVACKFEDQDSHAPRANLLCELLYRYTKIVYHQHEIVNMERLMLSMSGWRLMIPTAALFAPYFTAVGIDERTDFVGKSLVTSKNHNKNASDLDTQGTNFLPNTLADTPSPEPLSSVFDVERIKEAMEKIVDRMLLACLKEDSLRYYKPSVLAASCIAVARAYLNLSPPYSRRLQKIATHSSKDIESCFVAVHRTFDWELQRNYLDPAKVCIEQWGNFARSESILKSVNWSNDAPGTPPLSPNIPDDEALVTQLPVFSYMTSNENLSANSSSVWMGNAAAAAAAHNLSSETFAQIPSVPTPSSCPRMPVHVPGAPHHPPPDCCLASVNGPASMALNHFGQNFHQGYGDFTQQTYQAAIGANPSAAAQCFAGEVNYSNVLIRGNDPWLSEATSRNASFAVPIQQPNGNASFAVPIQQPNGNASFTVPIQQPNGNASFAVPIQQPNGNASFTVPIQQPNVMQKSFEVTAREDQMAGWQQNLQRQANGNGSASVVWNQAMPASQNVHNCQQLPNSGALPVEYRNQIPVQRAAAGNPSMNLPCVISQSGAFASNSCYPHQFYNISNSAMAKQQQPPMHRSEPIYDQKAPPVSSSSAVPIAVGFQAIPANVGDNGRFHIGNPLRIPEANGNHWIRNSYLSLPQSQIYYVPADSNDYYLVQPRNHPVFIIPSDMAQGRAQQSAVQSHENAAKVKRKAPSEQPLVTEAKKTCRSNN